jgi:NADPH:quinone reductase
MSMHAWQVQRHGSPRDVLRAVELDEPVPGPGELRVRVAAAAIGMPDVFMCRSTYPLTPPLPFVPGQEVCGMVDAVGDGVDVALGTRLMGVTSFTDGRGGLAEATILRADTAFGVPESMSAVDAASFRIGFSTAWAGLVRRGGLRAGEWVVVLGAAGGSGATAVQLGHALGARVIAVAAGREKLAFCERLGAEVTIDRTTESVPDAILAATNGRGADVVYDPVGGELAAAAMQGLGTFGRFLVVGYASGEWVRVNSHDLVWKSRSLVGVIASAGTHEEHKADHEAMLALAADGALGSFATVVPFDAVPDAVEAVAAGTVVGKLIVQVGTG